MERLNNKKTSFTKQYVIPTFLLLLTAIFIAFLAMLISTGGIDFITKFYVQFIVSVLFIFALLLGVAYTVKSGVRIKSQTTKYVTITVSAIFISLVITMMFEVFVDRMVQVLIFPALLVAVLMNNRVASIVNIMTSLIFVVLVLLEAIVHLSNVQVSAVIPTLLSLISGMLMITLVKRNYTRYKMIFGSIMYAILIAIASMPATLLYTNDIKVILANATWTLSGQAVAIALYSLLLPLYERIFEVYTDFRLAELASFSHPLLMRLREEAPGTFNHSLVVANLAESCALAVGEDPFLARVCAYYHDVGKLKNPKMFVENQDGSYNPHDELIPEVSARMITRHARAGYEILKEYHMPEDIARIAIEHHGTSSVMFFYLKAQKITEGKLSMSKYRYEGPKPSSKIAAIIMICDTCEAAVRSRQPKTEIELREFVGKMIKDKMDIHQFDDCDITFNDLKIIEDEIVKTIPSIFHHRIDYNKEKK